MLLEDGAGPFPDPAHLTLSSEFVAVRGHGDGMPMVEAYIGTLEVCEEL